MDTREQPPVDDPALQYLTVEQLSQLINEVSPDGFYERAAAFDNATARLEQIQDDLERETRNMWEAWNGRVAESFEDLVLRLTGLTGAVVQAMASPGYGAALRQAGDALARAQQRLRDLQTQNRQGDIAAVRQVLHDLSTAYRDLGVGILPLPEAVTEQPAGVNATGGAQGSGGGGGAATFATPGPQAVVQTGHHLGGTGAQAGPSPVPFAAFASLGVSNQAGPAAPGRQTVSPRSAGDEGDRVVPAVLGRGAAPAPLPMSGQESEKRHSEVAAVLGRTVKATEARPSAPKQKTSVAKHPVETEDQQVEPSAKAGEVVATSAGPVSHGPPVSSVPPVAGATQPSTAASTPAPEVARATAASASVPAAPPTPVPAPAAAMPAHTSGPGHVPSPHQPGSAALPSPAGHAAGPPHPGKAPMEAALPASPTFRPVNGGLDAIAPLDAPPLAPAGAGTGRVGGDSSFMGGYGGPMSRGVQGPDDSTNNRHPSGLIGPDGVVWNGAGDGAVVLGRPAAPPSPAAEDDGPLRGKDPESTDRPASSPQVLGRSNSRRES
ncbi:WXG100 family type VII secretion target [Amycolatopsis speibonae]|uniref:WXG100 family type VII secretion target n=1 Tax=Amycolatopsis speibonae TaxID=1450224 RepID=A0ABV7P320_9PSEU